MLYVGFEDNRDERIGRKRHGGREMAEKFVNTTSSIATAATVESVIGSHTLWCVVHCNVEGRAVSVSF